MISKEFLKKLIWGRRCKLFLRPSDLKPSGVAGLAPNTLGIVSLPLRFGENSQLIQTDFYALSNFEPPSDGLLRLKAIKSPLGKDLCLGGIDNVL